MRSCLTQRPKPPLLQSFKHQVQISGQIGLACAGGRRMRSHHEQTTLGNRVKALSHEFPEPPLHPVANHRRADRFAHYQAYSRLAGTREVAVRAIVAVFSGNKGVHGEEAGSGPLALPHDEPEVLRASHPRFTRQHLRGGRGRGRQALRRARPLLRRDAMIARPARVRMRSRKP